ncbi:hypothetical protein A6A20_01380 [Volucribacter amazonae]|uniref:Uncharacterized protein n=1 Tax=Volucribacter amazonae TaxID=256731 RepID=A0A9X4SPP2_9PAST|nr:hypothetical protein [Volucribacter amazonae]
MSLHFLSSYKNYFNKNKVGKASNVGIDFFIRNNAVVNLFKEKGRYILDNNLYIGENKETLNKTEFTLVFVDNRYGNIESMCDIY